MKKLILVSVLFLTVLGLSLGEMAYSNKMYGDLCEKLEVLQQRTAECDAPKTSENLALMAEIEAHGEKSRTLSLMLSNHTLTRQLDEKLVTLSAWLNENNAAETRVACAAAIQLVFDLRDETYPTLGNLF